MPFPCEFADKILSIHNFYGYFKGYFHGYKLHCTIILVPNKETCYHQRMNRRQVKITFFHKFSLFCDKNCKIALLLLIKMVNNPFL